MRNHTLFLVVILAASAGSDSAALTRSANGWFGSSSGGGTAAATMEVHGGKIYLLNDMALFKIDQATMKVEATASLAEAVEAKAEARAKGGVPLPAFLTRYDVDNDGKISEKEVPDGPKTWRALARYDRDRDGVILGEEAQAVMWLGYANSARMRKPAIIKIVGDSVLIFAHDRLFKFNRATLASASNLDVTDPAVRKTQEDRQKRMVDATVNREARTSIWRRRPQVKPTKTPVGPNRAAALAGQRGEKKPVPKFVPDKAPTEKTPAGKTPGRRDPTPPGDEPF
jgi:hypothetical protein